MEIEYTRLPAVPSMANDVLIQGIRGTIAFVGDPETKPDSKGKPYTKQEVRITSGDGGDVWCDVFGQSITVAREDKGRKVILCSTKKDGKMQGIKTNKYGDRPVRLTINSGANLTFADNALQPAQTPQSQPQPRQHSQQQQTQPQRQQSQPSGLSHLAALWGECYHAVLPICGEVYAVQAAATLFIAADKRNIGPTLTQPAAAIASFAPTARKIADEVLAKGGYDMDKLPSGDDLDAVVDLLIDKASETVSRERIGTAFDAFVKQRGGERDVAVKLLVSDWAMFMGGLK